MAAPTRPRNRNPFMATSPHPSAHRYLGLNVHDFNLTPAEYFLLSRSCAVSGPWFAANALTRPLVFIGTAGPNVRYGS